MIFALVLGLVLACSPSDGGWQAVDRALESWDAGRALLEAGKPEEAVNHFGEALAGDPDNATLWLWKGRALAEMGDEAGAVRAADRALSARPRFVEALYNRACWRARLGELEDAVVDVERVLELGGIDRYTMARDADLDGIRADPDLSSRVPPARLQAYAEADEQSFFVGSWWSVILTVTLPLGDDALEIEALGDTKAPLELVRVVEDRIRSGKLMERRLEYVFRVLGAGEGSVGPWRLLGAGLEAEVEPVEFRFLGSPGGLNVEWSDLQMVFVASEQRFKGLEETGAFRLGERVIARGRPGDRLERTDDGSDLLEIELRREGQPEWLAWEFSTARGHRVAVRREGALVYEGNP